MYFKNIPYHCFKCNQKGHLACDCQLFQAYAAVQQDGAGEDIDPITIPDEDLNDITGDQRPTQTGSILADPSGFPRAGAAAHTTVQTPPTDQSLVTNAPLYHTIRETTHKDSADSDVKSGEDLSNIQGHMVVNSGFIDRKSSSSLPTRDQVRASA